MLFCRSLNFTVSFWRMTVFTTIASASNGWQSYNAMMESLRQDWGAEIHGLPEEHCSAAIPSLQLQVLCNRSLILSDSETFSAIAEISHLVLCSIVIFSAIILRFINCVSYRHLAMAMHCHKEPQATMLRHLAVITRQDQSGEGKWLWLVPIRKLERQVALQHPCRSRE